MTYASWDLSLNKINYYLGVLILLPGSKKYAGKFNSEEVEIIERFMKKHNVVANQLVRRSIFYAIERAEYENAILADPQMRKIFKTIVDESQKIMTNPRIVKRLEKRLGFEKISQEDIDKLEIAASSVEKDHKTLVKKKKSGRSKIKRKRGKPKR